MDAYTQWRYTHIHNHYVVGEPDCIADDTLTLLANWVNNAEDTSSGKVVETDAVYPSCSKQIEVDASWSSTKVATDPTFAEIRRESTSSHEENSFKASDVEKAHNFKVHSYYMAWCHFCKNYMPHISASCSLNKIVS